MRKCEENIAGKPLFDYEDKVGFYITPYGGTEPIFFIGKIYIIDRWGTFEQNEEPSYDIMVENYDGTGKSALFKHIRQSSCYILED